MREHKHRSSSSSNAKAPSFLARLFIFFIRAYQLLISPAKKVVFGPTAGCRFVPTCSQYSREAYQRFGWRQGSWLTLKRLSRCHPFHEGGFDPIPDKHQPTLDKKSCCRHSAKVNHQTFHG